MLSLFGLSLRIELVRDPRLRPSRPSAARAARTVFERAAQDLDLAFAAHNAQRVWTLTRLLTEALVLARAQGLALLSPDIENWEPMARALGGYKAQSSLLKEAALYAQSHGLFSSDGRSWSQEAHRLFCDYPFTRFKKDAELAWALYERDALSASAQPAADPGPSSTSRL